MSDLFKKIRRKVIEFRRRFLPYNLHLRPLGVHSQDESDAFISISILPECTTDLTLPGSLYKDLSQYTIYDKVSERKPNTLSVTTNYQVYKIKDGRIYSNNVSLVSVISSDNQLVGNASFQYNNGKTIKPSESPILSQRYFQKPIKYKGTVFNMLAGGGAARGNVTHWMIDVIPRIYLLKQSGLFDEVDWYLVPQYKYDFQKQTLSHFGIESNRIIEGNDCLHLTADHIIASTHPRGERSFIIPQWLVDFYQTQFKLDKYIDPISPKRIYVSRKDSSLRKVVREDEIISGLKEMGFVSVELSNYDFYGKVRLFRNAEIVVSATGAGLGALLFSRKGTKILEIFSKSYTHSFYYNISIMAGLIYDFLVFDVNNEAMDMKHGLRDDLHADPEKIFSKVKSML